MDTLVRLVRWGDDFSLSGRRSLCNAFRDELGKHLLVQTTAAMGPDVVMGDVRESIHLNRLLRLYPPGAEGGERWELEGRRSTRGHPGVTVLLVCGRLNEDDGKELDAEGRACHRSWTMRAKLSQSRLM